MMEDTCKRVYFDEGSADVVPFDPAEVEKLLANGDVVYLLGIGADGSLTLFESPKNPIQFVDAKPPVDEDRLTRVALSLVRCGCKSGKRCVRINNTCVKGAVGCSQSAPPCS